MRMPVIGITTSANAERHGRPYAEAVEQAGGRAVYLNAERVNSAGIDAALESIDGLLLSGGKDVHPSLFASRSEPGDDELNDDELIAAYRMSCNLERDQYEVPLAKTAYESGIPILGICRGFQLLNITLGGGLIKDIRTERKHWAFRAEESDEGRYDESRKHMVTVDSDGILAGLLGDCPFMVNSRHHQGITERERAERLKATAFAPDGILEAVEGTDHPWAVAVQWHPERQVDDYIYEPCRALFSAFVRACEEHGRSSRGSHSSGNST